MSARHHSTQDHIEPERPETASAWPWLLAAYPRAAAFPLPASDEPVGRQWLADLGLNDGEVSTAHVRFVRVGGATILEDVGSKNGTWIDGHLVPPHEKVPVRDGALIRVGTTLLVHRQMLDGDAEPALPIGSMVGPFGLRRVAAAIETLRRYPPSNVLIEGETGTGKELAALPAYAGLETDWLHVTAPAAGADKGLAMLPDVDDHVLVLLADEDRSRGVVLGGLYGRGGIPDSGVSDGAVRRFTLRTAAGHVIQLDDESRSMKLTDATGNCLELTPGHLKLHAAVDLVIEAPGRSLLLRAQKIDFERQ